MARAAKRIVQPLVLLIVALVALNAAALLTMLQYRSQPTDFAAVVAQSHTAVVSIIVQKPERSSLSAKTSVSRRSKRELKLGSSESHGSGFIVDSSGLIVTNNHVITGALHVRVQLADGQHFEASVLGTDPWTDLALLKIESETPLPVLAFADSDALRIGEPIIAIGDPLKFVASVTFGVVSGLDRTYLDTDPVQYIQHDAAINPGSSGGPVLNGDGEVVAVNTAIADASPYDIGIALAIPSNTVRIVVADLRRHGRVLRPSLGVEVQQLEAELASALGRAPGDGLVVVTSTPGSPAALNGVQPGDILIRIGDDELRQVRDLALAIERRKVGDEVLLTLVRKDREHQVTVRLAKTPHAVKPPVPSTREPEASPVAARQPLGLTFASELKAKGRPAAAQTSGAVIGAVKPESLSFRAGLRSGDQVLAVGGTLVRNTDHAIEMFAKNRSNFLALLIQRAGEPQRFVVLPYRGSGATASAWFGNSVEPSGGPF